MTTDDIQQIINYAYPKIQKYYGTGKLSIPPIKFHHDIYARLSGDEEAKGEHSSTSIAEYDENENSEEEIIDRFLFEIPKDSWLEMNICDNGDGWNELCLFLNIPIPDIPFPYTNKGGSG